MTSNQMDSLPARYGLSFTSSVYRSMSIRTNPAPAWLISHMLPARSLDSGVFGPITGTPYAEPAGSEDSVRLYAFTRKRSFVGASKVFG